MYSRFDDIKPNRVDDFFAHHGIKGQKWGVRNYQNPDGTLTEAGKKRYYKGTGRKKTAEESGKGKKPKTIADEIAQYSINGSKESGYKLDPNLQLGKEYTVRDDVIKYYMNIDKTVSDPIREHDLRYKVDENRSQYKKAMAGAAAGTIAGGAALGAAYGSMGYLGGIAIGTGIGAAAGAAEAVAIGITAVSRTHKAKKADKQLEKTIAEINSNPNVDKKTGLKLIQGDHSETDDLAKVNPGYKNFSDTTKNNCMLCTTTYDLRRRGYDVTVGGANDGYYEGTMMSWYKGEPKLKVMDSASSTSKKYKELQALPEGSRGNLCVQWKQGGGHSMFFEIKDGDVIIRDGQTNKMYKGGQAKQILKETGMCKYVRLDNLEPNIPAMKKAGVFYTGETGKTSEKKVIKVDTKQEAPTDLKAASIGATPKQYKDAWAKNESPYKAKTTKNVDNMTVEEANEEFKRLMNKVSTEIENDYKKYGNLYKKAKTEAQKEKYLDHLLNIQAERDMVTETVMEQNPELAKKAWTVVKHADSEIYISFEDFIAGASIEHSGIKGMKWGERRYQYEDGSLTPAGRIRYLKGGDKEIRKAEKERAKREKILSDRKKLYKHRDEFTKEELDKAMEKFASEDRMKAQIEAEKEATRRAKEEKRQAKYDYKKMKLQAKMEERKLKEQDKQNKMQTEQKRLETETKEKTTDATSKAELWKQRANKAKNILDFAKTGRDILGDMGIISKDGNESLFGALAESIGLKDNSAAKAAAKEKKDREKLNADYDLENKKLSVENARLRNEQLKATIASLLSKGSGGGNNNGGNPPQNPPKNPSGGGNNGGGNSPQNPPQNPPKNPSGGGQPKGPSTTPPTIPHTSGPKTIFDSLDISSYFSNPKNQSFEFERHQTKKGNLDNRYHSTENLRVMDSFKDIKMSDLRNPSFTDSSGKQMAQKPNNQARLNSVGTRIEDFFKILNAKGYL